MSVGVVAFWGLGGFAFGVVGGCVFGGCVILLLGACGGFGWLCFGWFLVVVSETFRVGLELLLFLLACFFHMPEKDVLL